MHQQDRLFHHPFPVYQKINVTLLKVQSHKLYRTDHCPSACLLNPCQFEEDFSISAL